MGAVALGSAVTLLWGAATLGLLNAVYQGRLFWGIALIVAFGAGLLGGYVTAERTSDDRETMGTLGGAVAGLVALALTALVSGVAPAPMLRGGALVLIWAVAGWAGAGLAKPSGEGAA